MKVHNEYEDYYGDQTMEPCKKFQSKMIPAYYKK